MRAQTGTFQRIANGALEVVHPSGERTRIAIEPLPFRIGRGPDNHVILRDNRASRTHAWIYLDSPDANGRASGAYVIEDLDSTHGTWVNGQRIDRSTTLHSGDKIHFGFEDSYQLVFSHTSGRISRILDELSVVNKSNSAVGSFARLRAVIEVARTLQTTLASEDVLGAIVESAIALTGAERGFLLLRAEDDLAVTVGRDAKGAVLAKSELNVPTGLIQRALEERRELLFMQLDPHLVAAEKPVVAVEYSNVICVPLVQFGSINSQQTISLAAHSDTVGLLYLDSRKEQTALSELNRELLHTLALEASTVLENAKLLEEERQKHLLEQELEIARAVQQSLLPRGLPESGWFRAVGSSLPSADVGGDYFDVHPAGDDAWAAVLADVSGKGVSSALLASLLQGAFLLASELDMPLGDLMAKVNNFLIDRAQGEKYATLVYATIHRSGDLVWANAGHCAPLILRAGGELEELTTTGMPLGLVPKAAYEVKRLQLQPGDKIVAYSDGLTEAENRRKERFESKMRPALTAAAHLSAREIHDKLVEAVLQFGEGDDLQDDLTVLVMEYRAA
ncbi:MAG TPA: SpoIIE family protein phosphatase [Bryobacteraceae bacterium]|jgi:serine phosphatase RsbU (regulator of sigma subunit)/pSer/pThr/pTyr-binding forkhead associated (FHA) protein|nr:SpoIIE family protein phosphatase [Bryobacteraceae bacterium]